MVTPFVGVWIEIEKAKSTVAVLTESLPSWECGLKFMHIQKKWQEKKSLPSWECGLKSK